MSDQTPFERALRDELMAAARRGPRRRRWPWVTGIGAAIAALVASISFLGTNPASAEVKVSIKGGRVEVLLTDVSSTPLDVAKAVNQAGLDARVVSRPTGPSNVGRFVRVAVSDSTQPIEHIEEGVNSFMGFSLPEGWRGTLTIQIGRPAHRGELYAVSSDAFAKGEPLHCSGLVGRTLSDAAPHLNRLRVRVERVEDGHFVPPPVDLDPQLLSQEGSWHLVQGFAGSARDIILLVQPDPLGAVPRDPSC